MKLSPRLAYIASLVPKEHTVIDVAADHGYIAIELAKQNQNRQIIASDIAAGPLNAGIENARKKRITNIDFRQGDGFSVLEPSSSIDTAIIAGLGGKLMLDILNSGMSYEIKHLILQANNDVELIRQWLFEHNFHLLSDERIADGKFIYECLVALKKDQPDTIYSQNKIERKLEFQFGKPELAGNKPTLTKWLKCKYLTLEDQIKQMKRSNNPSILEEITKLEKQIAYCKILLANRE